MSGSLAKAATQQFRLVGDFRIQINVNYVVQSQRFLSSSSADDSFSFPFTDYACVQPNAYDLILCFIPKKTRTTFVIHTSGYRVALRLQPA